MANERVGQIAKTAFNILGSITMAIMLLIIKDAWAWRQAVEDKNDEQDKTLTTLTEKQLAVTQSLERTSDILDKLEEKMGNQGERLARVEGR